MYHCRGCGADPGPAVSPQATEATPAVGCLYFPPGQRLPTQPECHCPLTMYQIILLSDGHIGCPESLRSLANSDP